MQSASHPSAQRNAFHRRDARRQSRLCDPRNRRLRPSPRKDKRGADLISDLLPFGRLWYGEPNAVDNAVGYAQFYSRSQPAVIRVYDETGNVIETQEHKGDFKEP
jgi:hypothetical protein